MSTTAGTGSETSFAFVITDTTTDPDKPQKFASFAHAVAPSLAIDDPVLFYSLPSDLTAYCGFDVLAHAVSAYVSILDRMSDVQAADAALDAARRLADDVGIPQNFTSLTTLPLCSKSRVGEGGYARSATMSVTMPIAPESLSTPWVTSAPSPTRRRSRLTR